MELIDLKNVMETLEQYAQDVRNAYQDNLIKNDRIASGDLLNSVEYRVIHNGVEYEVQLKLQDYWKYVEEGVQGARNLTSPYRNPGWKAYPFILKWIEVKPVLPRPNAEGKLPTQKQLAYLITRSIVENGTRGSNDLEDALKEINAKYRNKLVIALHDDMDTLMKVIVGNFQGSVPGR